MKYFVYQHIRLDKNEPFYIGVGTIDKNTKGYKTRYKRAFSNESRNPIWENIFKKTTHIVEILKEFETKKEALEFETKLIKNYGLIRNKTGILANLIEDSINYYNNSIYLASRHQYNMVKNYKYSLEGDYIREYNSYMEASKDNNCTGTEIRNAANLKTNTAEGFQWRLFKQDKIEEYNRYKNFINKSKLIYQYDLEGNFIKEWRGTLLPSIEYKVSRTSIIACLTGKYVISAGYIWRKYKKDKIEGLNSYNHPRNYKKIGRYSLEGYLIDEWNSVKEICINFNCSIESIYSSLKGKVKNPRSGYFWKYI